MSKKFDTKNLKLSELNTVKAYISWLEKHRGIVITKQGIKYQIDNTDNLDWCEWQDNIFIIMNTKAKMFTPKEKR